MSRQLLSRRRHRPRYAGLTLVELMVSMLIGSLIMIGAVQLLVNSRRSHALAESMARLEENARYAIATLELDASLAGFWGVTSHAVRKHPDRALGVEAPPAVAADCGPGWAVAIDEPLGARNNSYLWGCAAYTRDPVPGADTFVLRRAAIEAAVSAESDRLYLWSTRFGAVRVLDGAAVPAIGEPGLSAVHELVVHGYYVAGSSSLSAPGRPVPSLRMKTLVGGDLGPRIIDQEVFPGVEDLQVELGVDTDLPGTPGRGDVDLYLDADDPLLDPDAAEYLPHAELLAVRFWLRVRAARPETGFVDTRSYAYADRVSPPPRDGYRRELVTTTVYLRNTGGGGR